MSLDMPKPILEILERIRSRGGDACVVGGALRDRILGRPVKDYDIAASLTPDEILSLFADCQTYTIGKRFGTITVVLDGMPAEITTYRGETGYSDYRRPDRVFFVQDIQMDLTRRDFTINAMAYCPLRGLIDPFGGQSDLEHQRIRTVGDPAERFSEDPLRMLRAVRFAAHLSFHLVQETQDALAAHKNRLKLVAKERIREEMEGILMAPKAGSGIALLKETGLLTVVLGQTRLQEPLPEMDVLPHDLALRLAVLLRSEGCTDPEAVRPLLNHLRFNKETLRACLRFLSAYAALIASGITPVSVKKVMAGLGFEDTCSLLQWYRIGQAGGTLSQQAAAQAFAHGMEMAEAVRRRKDPLTLKDLALTGEDLLCLPVFRAEPRLIGDALQTALQWVLEDPGANRADLLLRRLQAFYPSRDC